MSGPVCTQEYWDKKRKTLPAPLIRELVQEAESFLSEKPLSVTQKVKKAPFGDAHDYSSIPKYSFPDPDNPDGPWIYRDGCINPDFEVCDIVRWMAFCRRTTIMVAAGNLSGDIRFFEQAGRWLKTWFIAPETRMRPHLKYAQVAPGGEGKNGGGIIDFHPLCQLIEAVASLPENKEWTAADLTKFRFWLKDYLLWILSSPITQQEATSANNHGSWHDAQITVLCAFLGLEGLAQKLIQEKTLPRMKNQITFLGEQPFEFVGTLSLSYSCFNLLALMRIDAYAGQWGFHLWDEGINRAFHYLAPYLCRPEKWPFRQIAAWDKVEFIQLCSMVNDFEESYDVFADYPTARAADLLFCIPSGH